MMDNGETFESFGFSHIPQEDYMRVVRFIMNYARDHSVKLRARHPEPAPFEGLPIWKLPLSMNKATVWGFYKHAVVKLGCRVVDLINFKRIWEYYLSQIIIEENQTDLCWLCHNSNRLRASSSKFLANLPDGLKLSEIIQAQQQHLALVEKENLLYQEMNAKCGMICDAFHLSLGPSRPASRKITMSYSFDYAQQVHYPSDPLQPGPLYFFSPRKCQLFGVCCGGMPKQVSYIIDEGMVPRRAVINFMHHYFNNYGVGETYADLHSSEGNRNDSFLWYCAWRTMHNLHLKLAVHFRIVGHDMSGPDLLFGLVKQVLRKTRVQTLSDIAAVVRDSTPKKQLNIPQLVGLEDGTLLVETYEWDQHLSSYFRCFPHIERYQHFSFDAQRPGVVIAREHCDAEPLEFQLLCNPDVRPSADHLPVQIPPGVDMSKGYLFREFWFDDCLCPPPKSTAPQKKKSV